MKKWCTKKFQMDDKTLNKMFEIPEDMDYIDEWKAEQERKKKKRGSVKLFIFQKISCQI